VATYKIPFDVDGRNTPLVFIDHELGPQGTYLPAPFLPLVRAEKKFETYVVMSAGKILAHASKGTESWLVPAGLKLQAEAYKTAFEAASELSGGILSISKDANGAVVETDAAHGLSVGDVVVIDGGDMTEITTATAGGVSVTAVGDATHFTLGSIDSSGYTTYSTGGTWSSATDEVTAARAVTGLTLYTSTDVTEGVKDAQGAAAVAGVPVVEGFFTPASLLTDTLVYDWEITKAVGALQYNAFRHYGGTGNPVDYLYHNFKTQNGVAFTRRGEMELPAVTAASGFIMPGLTVFVVPVAYYSGSDVLRTLQGVDMTYNMNSDLTVWVSGTDAENVRIGTVDYVLPLSEMPYNYLDAVRTGGANLPAQFAQAGSATAGLDNSVYLVGDNALGKLYAHINFF